MFTIDYFNDLAVFGCTLRKNPIPVKGIPEYCVRVQNPITKDMVRIDLYVPQNITGGVIILGQNINGNFSESRFYAKNYDFAKFGITRLEARFTSEVKDDIIQYIKKLGAAYFVYNTNNFQNMLGYAHILKDPVSGKYPKLIEDIIEAREEYKQLEAEKQSMDLEFKRKLDDITYEYRALTGDEEAMLLGFEDED